MRVSLLEYGCGVELSEIFPPEMTRANINRLVDIANTKIRKHLKINRTVLSVSSERLRALGIAGTIRLTKDIELEIVPKIFSTSTDAQWKSSLFLLAALSKYGSIISRDYIHASTTYQDSLFDIAGRILAEGYTANKRKPLRMYRRERFSDFSIDGEIDFDTIHERNPDGISQERIVFDKINSYNATIKAAMRIVLPYVHDISVQNVIKRALQELGKQCHAPQHKALIPARNKEWGDVYNLSFDIVKGMGSSFDEGEILSPSFIVDTWRIWEWLITLGLKTGLGSDYIVIPQATTEWGTKTVNRHEKKIQVFPDVSVYDRAQQMVPAFLVDAKYKKLDDDASFDVERSDLYEAFAFCNATGAKKLYLAYPAPLEADEIAGSVTLLAEYRIRDVEISAIHIGFGSVNRQGNILSFCQKLSRDLESLAR